MRLWLITKLYYLLDVSDSEEESEEGEEISEDSATEDAQHMDTTLSMGKDIQLDISGQYKIDGHGADIFFQASACWAKCRRFESRGKNDSRPQTQKATYLEKNYK